MESKEPSVFTATYKEIIVNKIFSFLEFIKYFSLYCRGLFHYSYLSPPYIPALGINPIPAGGGGGVIFF